MLCLYNIFSKKKLKFNMLLNNEKRITISFYRYYNIVDPIKFRNTIYYIFNRLNILGRVYIAKEGINAQISILNQYFHILKNFLFKLDIKFKNIKFNISLNQNKSFWFLQVKVRNNIVADGLEKNSINYKNVGVYLTTPLVNKFLDDSSVIFVDMRNYYEYKIGRFRNAINIPGVTFKSQLNIIVKYLKKYINKKIVLYCTGGIRCEKATALLKHNKFQKVYHIQGGILNYVNESKIKKIPIKFQGKIFVFDHRMFEKVSEHILSKCQHCGNLSDNYINCKNDLCHLLFIQCYRCYMKYQGYCSVICNRNEII